MDQLSRTVVAARHAAASLAVGRVTGVLLEVGVGHAACAVRHGAVLVLAGHDGGRVLGQGGDEAGTGDGEEDGGERELHLG